MVRTITKTTNIRVALGFSEFNNVLNRPRNDEVFRNAGFSIVQSSGSESKPFENTIEEVLTAVNSSHGAVAFDISSMTRVWHGAIVRKLRTMKLPNALRTFFVYVPAKFQDPPSKNPDNEVVEPVEGFASLMPPDLPVAAILGLGCEREKALGIEQLLDPKLTALMIPRFGGDDRFYAWVLRNNRYILEKTRSEWKFDYRLDAPAATFNVLNSVVGGLVEDYRVVLASFGPKILGVLCFLLAAKQPEVSVWRISSGRHASPRDASPDLKRTVVFEVLWTPS